MIRRLRVTIDWTLDLFFPRDITQLQPHAEPQLRAEHYEPGEIIVSRNEIGRELFVIRKGEVEVQNPDGSLVATLKDGEVFGEKALLTDAPRTANVVAKTAVDVLVMTRGGFKALVSQLHPLEDYFSGLLRQRYPELVPQHATASSIVAATATKLPPPPPPAA
jgi:CRP-like cAMP-binding protein